MSTDLIVTIIVAFLTGGGIAGLLNALNARRKAPSEINSTDAGTEKIEAETANILVNAAGTMVALVKKELEVQIKKVSAENGLLKCEVTELRSENEALRGVQQRHETEINKLQKVVEMFDEVLNGAHLLYSQVVELNGKPVYKPPERRKKE